MKSESIKRLCARWKAHDEPPRPRLSPWWSGFVDDVHPDEVVAVRGPWLLQRHLLALVVAGFSRDDEATLRGPTALLEEVIEEALTLRAGLLRTRVRIGFLNTSDWEALAMAAGATVGGGFKVRCAEDVIGVELESTARWCFGMHVPHPDVDIEVTMEQGTLQLNVLDGCCTPPRRRRTRLQPGRLQACGDDENRLLASDDDDDCA